MKTIRLTGHAAIRYAEIHGVTLNKYADPIEEAREGLSVEEARQVAAEDPSLIWLDAEIRAGFYGTDYATYYVTETGRVWLVQSDEDDPATLPREIDWWNYEAVPCDDLVGSDYPALLRGVEE